MSNQFNYKVYQKATHTDRCLHKSSNHHPSAKQRIIKILMETVKLMCAPERLQK